jgi:hypothetical protein
VKEKLPPRKLPTKRKEKKCFLQDEMKKGCGNECAKGRGKKTSQPQSRMIKGGGILSSISILFRGFFLFLLLGISLVE